MKRKKHFHIIGVLAVGIGSGVAVASIVLLLPPDTWLARGMLALSSGIFTASIVRIARLSLTRGIIVGFGVASFLAIRLAALDSILNILLLAGVLVSFEVYFRKGT